MNAAKFVICCAAVLALLTTGFAMSQEKGKALPGVNREREHRQTVRAVAEKAYLKLVAVNEKNPGAVSQEHRSAASLELLKADISLARSRADAIQAATEYLEREGVGKP